MKILISGGAGFIASNIADAYVAIGHQVVVVDHLGSGRKEYLNPAVTFYEADITDKSQMEEIFKREQPGILNHHAAQMEVRKSVADPVFDAKVNILGFLTLAEAGRKYGLKKIIFASSGGAIYGDAKILPTPETYDPQPASPYGVSKLATEYYLNFYQEAYGINFVALRYGNVYGPRQNPHGEAGVIAIFAQKMLKGQTPIINGDGTQERDFVFISDVVDANVKSISLQKSAKINIGTGVATNVNTIFKHLSQIIPGQFSEKHGPAKLGEQRVSLLDINLAKEILNWHPQVALAAGLTKTVEFFKT
jgi:UDP-glucose 4-epimerase